MPKNKNAMTRYKILDELLSNRYHNYSLDDLTEEVNNRLSDINPETDGVGRRTIEHDIEYLEYKGPFEGVDIERYYVAAGTNGRKKMCLRYASPNFSIFSKPLTDDEEYLLKEALSLLGQFEGLPSLEGLEGLRLGLGVRDNERKIVSFTKNPLENSNIFGKLFTAISERQVIELHHHKFNDPNKGLAVAIYPYLLKEYNRRWYLFGSAESDLKLLNFALDRIDDVVPLPSHKYVDYDGDLNERFEDIVGVTLFDDSPLYEIYFWVSDMSKDYVGTKPIHESQRTLSDAKVSELRERYPALDGGRFYRIDCKENYELIRELASFGKELVVLEPSEIQDKIWERICGMEAEYMKVRK